MPNSREKMVRVLAEEGTTCLLNMQVADVKQPIMTDTHNQRLAQTIEVGVNMSGH